MADKQKELEEAQARNVELQDEKENVIDRYMYTKDFKGLMTAHDSLIYPEYFKDGWDGAIKTILERHPEAFNATDFPCPRVTLPEGTYVPEDRMEEVNASSVSSSGEMEGECQDRGQNSSS